MYVPDVQLHQVGTLQQATAVLTRYSGRARVLAGGTDLLVDLKTGRVQCDHLVSLHRIAGLRGIFADGDGLRVGALTTITELARSPVVRERFAPLREAAGRMASVQIRNLATVGGNIAAAVPCADLPPILIAMNAFVRAWSGRGQREVPLEAFFTGPRQTILETDEVLTEVQVPRAPVGFGAAYARFQLREGNAIAVAAVAAGLRLDPNGRIEDVRVVLGAVAPVPKLVDVADMDLGGQFPDEGFFQTVAERAMSVAQPISDVRGSAEFRRHLVGVLTCRALAVAARRAQEAR